MLIDAHSHLNFAAFKDDSDKVISKTLENDVWLINVGSQYETSKRAVEIAKRYEKGVYAAIGLHPIHLETGLVKIKNDEEEIEVKTKEESFDYEKYKELARSASSGQVKPKVVAIGETGLDYYWRPKTKTRLEQFKNKQKEALLKQLQLAKELSLPVILHCRFAHNDLINELKNCGLRIEGVLHGFVGATGQLQEYLEMGLYIGFNGIIFKKIEGINFEENIKKTSLDKILIETDCPYLTPPPAEGRNEPLNIKYIAEKIAKIKNISYEEVAKITTENAKKVFKI